jgi:antitoxin CptB
VTETGVPGRLRWQCRRGMLELDVLLGQFVDSQWATLDESLKQEFEDLLAFSDQQLQQWLCEGREADEKVRNITRTIRAKDSN